MEAGDPQETSLPHQETTPLVPLLTKWITGKYVKTKYNIKR